MGVRELLELAAKTACISGGWGDKIEYHNGAVDLRDVWILEGDDFVPWNPLTDDGDALRLAVTCKIALNPTLVDGLNRDLHESAAGGVNRWTDCREKHNGDPFAATRRAIVRAAAKIGRVM